MGDVVAKELEDVFGSVLGRATIDRNELRIELGISVDDGD